MKIQFLFVQRAGWRRWPQRGSDAHAPSKGLPRAGWAMQNTGSTSQAKGRKRERREKKGCIVSPVTHARLVKRYDLAIFLLQFRVEKRVALRNMMLHPHVLLAPFSAAATYLVLFSYADERPCFVVKHLPEISRDVCRRRRHQSILGNWSFCRVES